MTKLPQVSHERIVRALKRRGFYILREGRHISMSDDKHLVIIPRHHTIKPGTLRQILEAAEISPEQFKTSSESFSSGPSGCDHFLKRFAETRPSFPITH